MKTIIKLFACLSVLFVVSCSHTKEPRAKYVFLFIGDGMGPAQVYSTEVFKASVDGKIGRYPLVMSQFPVQSYATTFSANDNITCSSASATAIATGIKTNNSFLGVGPDTLPLITIAEKAKNAGKRVGLISSVGINHATPGSFFGHRSNRRMYDDIAIDLIYSNLDFYAGSGVIQKRSTPDNAEAIYRKLDSAGFRVACTVKDIDNLHNGDTKVIAVNPVVRSSAEFEWVIDKADGALPLSQFVRKGIEVLDNNNGFFMMCEGGKIDWACHYNDLASALYETMAFDSAVAVAVDFFNRHPDETLIIVTADHETGGLTLGSQYRQGINPEYMLQQKISLDAFNDKIATWSKQQRKPTFAEILDSINVYFGLGSVATPLTDKEIEWLRESYDKEFLTGNITNPDNDYLDVSARSLGEKSVYLLTNKAGFRWATPKHTALPVPVRAMGQGQEYFKGSIDNSDIARIIERLMLQ